MLTNMGATGMPLEADDRRSRRGCWLFGAQQPAANAGTKFALEFNSLHAVVEMFFGCSPFRAEWRLLRQQP